MDSVDQKAWSGVTDLLDEVNTSVRSIIGISDDVKSAMDKTQSLLEAVMSLRDSNNHFRDFFDHDTTHFAIALDTLIGQFRRLWERREKRSSEQRVTDYFGDSFDGPSQALYDRVMSAVELFKHNKDESALREVIIDYMMYKVTDTEKPNSALREEVKVLLDQEEEMEEEGDDENEENEAEKAKEVASGVRGFFCILEIDGPDKATDYHIYKPAKEESFRQEIIALTLAYCMGPDEEPGPELQKKIQELDNDFINLERIKGLREDLQDKRREVFLKREQTKILAYLLGTTFGLRAYDFWVANQPFEIGTLSVSDFFSEEAQVFFRECFIGFGKIEIDIHDQNEIMSLHAPTIGNLIMNMIKNAGKHGEAKNIKILAQKQGDVFCIEVADDGKGISDKIVTKIFEEGWTSGEGTGLGLAKADQRLELMGGKIEVAGHGGIRKGALFRIILPLAKD